MMGHNNRTKRDISKQQFEEFRLMKDCDRFGRRKSFKMQKFSNILLQATLCLLLVASITQANHQLNNHENYQRIIEKRQVNQEPTTTTATSNAPTAAAASLASEAVGEAVASVVAPSDVMSQSDQPMQKAKIQPIDYKLIDELFEARMNETEVAKKWKSLDKQLVEGECKLYTEKRPNLKQFFQKFQKLINQCQS